MGSVGPLLLPKPAWLDAAARLCPGAPGLSGSVHPQQPLFSRGLPHGEQVRRMQGWRPGPCLCAPRFPHPRSMPSGPEFRCLFLGGEGDNGRRRVCISAQEWSGGWSEVRAPRQGRIPGQKSTFSFLMERTTLDPGQLPPKILQVSSWGPLRAIHPRSAGCPAGPCPTAPSCRGAGLGLVLGAGFLGQAAALLTDTRGSTAYFCNTWPSRPWPSSPCCASCCCPRAVAAHCPRRCRTPTACAAPRSSGATPARTTCPCCQPPSPGPGHSWSGRGDQAAETRHPPVRADGSQEGTGGWWEGGLFAGGPGSPSTWVA